jgi:RNA polymerase sigma factor (sigma-70 family)
MTQMQSAAHSASRTTTAGGAVPTGAVAPGGGDVAPGTPIDWSAALAKHERWLRTVVGARVGEAQAVDEVMQEVSLAAVRGTAPIADRTKIAPWLYQLAVRQSLLYRRKVGRRRKLVGQYAERFHPTEQDSRTADPLDWLLAEERQRLVRQALAKLVPRDSEILLLKYIEGWSYHELAEHMGVSHSAAEARLHRARAHLREQLATLNVSEVTQ